MFVCAGVKRSWSSSEAIALLGEAPCGRSAASIAVAGLDQNEEPGASSIYPGDGSVLSYVAISAVRTG